MKTLLTLLTTAMLLSISPAMASAPDCAKPPLTPAADIAASIDQGVPATPTVVFERGTAKLAPASRGQLAELVALLDDQLDLHIQVGFAAGDKPELAQARAKALRNALLDLDAPADRVAVREAKADAEIAKVEIAGGAQQCAAPVAGS